MTTGTVVDKNHVIQRCQKTLNDIYFWRSQHRRKYVEKYLQSMKFWHQYFWWLGVPQPTRRNAIFSYYHGSKIPASFTGTITYGLQETKCKELLDAALIAKKDVLVSSDGIRICNL